MSKQQFLSVAEAAEKIGVTDFSLRSWVKLGRMTNYGEGRGFELSAEQVDEAKELYQEHGSKWYKHKSWEDADASGEESTGEGEETPSTPSLAQKFIDYAKEKLDAGETKIAAEIQSIILNHVDWSQTA